eukprot:6114207-Karenia_brevis.AAC.1
MEVSINDDDDEDVPEPPQAADELDRWWQGLPPYTPQEGHHQGDLLVGAAMMKVTSYTPREGHQEGDLLVGDGTQMMKVTSYTPREGHQAGDLLVGEAQKVTSYTPQEGHHDGDLLVGEQHLKDFNSQDITADLEPDKGAGEPSMWGLGYQLRGGTVVSLNPKGLNEMREVTGEDVKAMQAQLHASEFHMWLQTVAANHGQVHVDFQYN